MYHWHFIKSASFNTGEKMRFQRILLMFCVLAPLSLYAQEFIPEEGKSYAVDVKEWLGKDGIDAWPTMERWMTVAIMFNNGVVELTVKLGILGKTVYTIQSDGQVEALMTAPFQKKRMTGSAVFERTERHFRLALEGEEEGMTSTVRGIIQ
jgi:hypothetical protein